MRQSIPVSSRVLLVAGLFLATVMVAVGVIASAGAAVTPKQQLALDAQARKLISNGRYVGARGDGSSVDMTFCRTGKYRSQVDNGISNGRKWVVRAAKFRKNGFDAIVAENKDRRKGGFGIAIAKRGTKWYIGIESFDTATKLGLVVRKPAGGECPAG
jgi:hypothetical protein